MQVYGFTFIDEDGLNRLYTNPDNKPHEVIGLLKAHAFVTDLNKRFSLSYNLLKLYSK